MTSPEFTIDLHVKTLLTEASNHLSRNELDKAIAKYTEVLLHDKDNQEAVSMLEKCWAVKRGERPLSSVIEGTGPVNEAFEDDSDRPKTQDGEGRAAKVSLSYGQDLPPVQGVEPVIVSTKPVIEPPSQQRLENTSGQVSSSIERFTNLERTTTLELNISDQELKSLELDPLSEWALKQVDGKKTIEELAETCLLEPEQVITMFEDLMFRGVVSPVGPASSS